MKDMEFYGIPDAEDIGTAPVDGVPLVIDNVQEFLEYLLDISSISASPGFTWGKGGSVVASSYLYNEDVESSRSGRLVPFDGEVRQFFVNNSNQAGTKTLQLRRRRPCQTGSWTTIGSVIVPAGESCSISTDTISVLAADELAVRVAPGSASFKDVIVGVVINKTFQL